MNPTYRTPSALGEHIAEPGSGGGAALIRTQIYLQPEEHAFLLAEATRTGRTMAAVIRELVQGRMRPAAGAWADNSLLTPPADDPAFPGHARGASEHDALIYGGVAAEAPSAPGRRRTARRPRSA